MSNKTNSEITSDIVIAMLQGLGQSAAGSFPRPLEKLSEEVAAAYKVIFKIVSDPFE